MPVSLLEMQEFRDLFVGDRNHFGVFIPDGTKESNGKVNGKAFMEHTFVTDEHYMKHLEGTKGLGLCPIYNGTDVVFSVIDVDDYSTAKDKERIVSTIYDNGMPLFPFLSKSGGLHIYSFFKGSVSAELAISLMDDYRRLFMLPIKTEIFPKQKRLGDKSYGSWINLPYFGAGSRQLLSSAMEPVPLKQGLAHISSTSRNYEDARLFFDRLPLNDAPPCLQCIHLARTTHARNNFLVSFAVYAKTKLGERFEEMVEDANTSLIEPIDNLEETVLRSARKKDYSYMCGDTPIHEICDKKCCQGREYGIGGNQVNDLSYGQLTQFLTDPPYYRWEINNTDLVFRDEAEIINQTRFRELALRSLGHLPFRIAEKRWVSIINTALGGMVRDAETMSKDLSEGGTLVAAIGEFLTQRVSARTLEHVLMGKVYHDNRNNLYIFKSNALLDFLTVHKSFKNTARIDVNEKLRLMGGNTIRKRINDRNPTCRVWTVPYSALEGIVDDLSDITPEAFNQLQEADDNEY